MRRVGIVYDFGHFRLLAGEGVLYCGGKPVALTPKGFEVLRLLVENSGHVVEKREFMKTVWPDAIVEDANLAQTIFTLRKTLGETHRDHQSHEYIETIPRRGYRFVAPVKIGNESLVGAKSAPPAAVTEIGLPTFVANGNNAEEYNQQEAPRFYRRGQYYWKKYTVASLRKGIESFQECIKSDAKFALAYTGLADCYYRLANICLAPGDAIPKALTALAIARELDPTIAEGHALLGLILMFYHHDWRQAEVEFRRALIFAPDDARIHQRFGLCLALIGRLEDGIAELNQALQLNPLSRQIRIALGTIFRLARQPEEAVRQAHDALDLDPDFYGAHLLLGLAYIQQQKLAKGSAEFEIAVSLENEPFTLGYLGYGYAAAGRRAEALQILDVLLARARQTYVSPYTLALIYSGLGEKDRAIELLEQTYQDRHNMFSFIGASPELDCLRGEEAFVRLLDRSKLTGEIETRYQLAYV